MQSSAEPEPSSKTSASDDEDTSRVIIPDELPSFKYIGENDHFEIYENQLYIPMGFGYDKYVKKSDADNKSKLQRQNVLMKALVLSDEQAEKYSDILTEYEMPASSALSRNTYTVFCKEKRMCCSKKFTYDSHGFTSVIDLSKPQLVFFSVPYSEGWTAEVNGVPADVERVDEGFMAVRADTGENTIVFRYETPYLRTGIIISLCSAAVLVIYVLIFRRKRGGLSDMKHYYDYTSCEKIQAAQQYCDSLFKKERK